MSAVTEIKSSFDIPTIHVSELDKSNDIVNQKLVNAAKLGFFYLTLTEEWKKPIKAGEHFAKNFPSGPDVFQEIYSEDIPVPIGYSKPFGIQCESFRLITKKHWGDHFSPEVIALGSRMIELCLKVTQATLRAFSIPEELWDKAVGNATEGKDFSTFTFNRYTAEREGKGYPIHRDSGLVTALFINQSGLEGRIADSEEWSPIKPKENHLLINFGQSLAFLFSADPKRTLIAVEHRVARLNKGRISFATFFDRDCSSLMYRIVGSNLQKVPSKRKPEEQMTALEFQSPIGESSKEMLKKTVERIG